MNTPSKTKTDIIARMEAMQQRFGDTETLRALQFALRPLQLEDSFPSILQSAENERRLQLNDTPPESARQILRCAPPFDAQAEHENDLRYESRVDYESWKYDGPEEQEAE